MLKEQVGKVLPKKKAPKTKSAATLNAGKSPQRKRNLDQIREAAVLHEQFVGSPTTEIVKLSEPEHVRDDYAHLGWLCQLVFLPPTEHEALDLEEISEMYQELMENDADPVTSWRSIADEIGSPLLVFSTEGDEIRLASSADGRQLYFLGGRQDKFAESLDEFGADTEHDFVMLGQLISLTYTAQKRQAGDTKAHPYYHVFGEEGGEPPTAFYDRINKRIRLAGGSYHLNEPERGIIN